MRKKNMLLESVADPHIFPLQTPERDKSAHAQVDTWLSWLPSCPLHTPSKMCPRARREAGRLPGRARARTEPETCRQHRGSRLRWEGNVSPAVSSSSSSVFSASSAEEIEPPAGSMKLREATVWGAREVRSRVSSSFQPQSHDSRWRRRTRTDPNLETRYWKK